MRAWAPLAFGVWLAVVPAGAAEVIATGQVHPALAPFDRLMTGFLQEHNLPGAALAVAKDGRLVYSRGFGYADRARHELVHPGSLFRIASVSKPLTAVAVLRLVEQGKLRLNDHVFEVLQLAPPRGPKVHFDERWKHVTILHLLQHTGGWDRDRSFDPMFVSPDVVEELKVPPPAKPDDVIQYVLRRPLEFDPGSKHVYSNFGYCLLGRVIEKVSGQGYEDYVCNEVLAPLGATHVRLGKTLLSERAKGEVKYYVRDNATAPAIMGPNLGKPVPLPYGTWCIEAMDAHGGWIASAEDLVRFASAFNDPATCKVLGEKSIHRMFAPPAGPVGHRKDGKPKGNYYACGWQVVKVGPGQVNTFHTGLLDGTNTILVRRFDGLTWAVLFNAHETPKGKEPVDLIDGLVHEAADAVKHWPEGK
jgi:CubicO group peptidase (beta-lactamase class C family)